MGDLEEGREPLLVENGTTMWNGAVAGSPDHLGDSAVIELCFTVRPILVQGSTICPNQGTYTDCDGNALSGTLPGSTPWVTGSSSNVRSALRNYFRETIERTWLTHANIEVIGWGNCPIDAGTNKHDAADLTNRVVVTFDEGDTSGWGASSTQPTYITLNWRAMNSVEIRDAHRPNLFHEFGHTLGFRHEWQRTDWTLPEDPAYAAQPNLTGEWLGTAKNDTDSIMDYSDGPTVFELSAWDIIGVQNAYGRKPTGSLVGDWGQCANVQGASYTNGMPIISYPCRGQSNDRFVRPWSSWKLKSYMNNRCMRIPNVVAGGPVESWDCSSGSALGFYGVEWRVMGNMCIERVVAGDITILELRTCNGSASQKWDFFTEQGGTANGQDYFDIRKPGTTKCVKAGTVDGAMGELLRMGTCSTTATRQRFGFPGGGVISYNNNQSLCMNASGGVPESGRRIILWDGCGGNGTYNNRFHLHGPVRERHDAYCLEAQGRGSQVLVNNCSSANPQQVWDYYL